MPRIVRTGGVNLSDDVVKIRDLCPHNPAPLAKAKQKPNPKAPPQPDDGEGLLLDGEELDLDAGMLDEEGEYADSTNADFTDDYPISNTEEAYNISAGGNALKEEIVQAAVAEAGRILEEAVREGERQRQEIVQSAQAEVEMLRQQAQQQGRSDAFEAVMGETKQAADSLEDAVARYEGERAGFEAEYEDQLKWLAMEIASKVLAKKVAENDAEMLEMVDKAVQSVRSEAWIRVEVAQEMVHLIDQLGALYEGQANIEVSAVPAAPGSVQIETPSGVVDASLKTQLENLKDYFATAIG